MSRRLTGRDLLELWRQVTEVDADGIRHPTFLTWLSNVGIRWHVERATDDGCLLVRVRGTVFLVRNVFTVPTVEVADPSVFPLFLK